MPKVGGSGQAIECPAFVRFMEWAAYLAKSDPCVFAALSELLDFMNRHNPLTDSQQKSLTG